MANEPDLVISAGFSDSQLTREASKVLEFYKKRGEEAQKAFQDAQGRVTNTAAMRAHQKELDRLSKAYDPAYRAAKQYEAEVKQLDRALSIGAVTQGQYSDRLQIAAERMRQATSTVERTSGRMGGAIQNTAYQIGDFAVQVGAGTSATQALAQQLPQLLGGFGVLGAVLGASAAIILPLTRAIMESGDASKSFEDAIGDASSALNSYSEYATLAASPTSQLRKEFGVSAGEARQMYVALRDLAELRAMDTIADAAKAVADELAGVGEALEWVNATDATLATYTGARNMRVSVERLNEEFGLTVEQARAVKAALDEVSAAQGPQQIAQAMSNLSRMLLEVRDEAGLIPEPLRAAAENAAKAAIEGLKMGSAVESAGDAARDLASVDIASGIAGATTEARLLAATLGIALEKAIAIENKGRKDPGGSRVGFGLGAAEDPSFGSERLSYGNNPGESAARRHVTPFVEPDKPTTASSGGRSGAPKLNKDLEDAKRLFESTKTPAQRLADEIARINELAGEFPALITPEVQAKAIDDLTGALGEAEQRAKAGSDAMANLFGSIVSGSMSAKDAVRNLLGQIAQIQLQNALSGLGSGGGFGWLGGLLTPAAQPSFGGFRAAGGPVSPGKAYVVGEKGPEVLVPGSVGSVIPNHHLGGNSAGTINIDVTGATGNAEVQRMVSAGIAQGLQAYDQQMPQRLQQINQNPRYR